ncbi:MAG: A/G-specific adenine glycosylase [Prolixibacteraceae bacterium]|jgi:A/G-specific adenine glycosylase|nr:A/G-specific adenine glycosylase [Prolixibacteraceae bacterium]
MGDFNTEIYTWYAANRRDLPWRETGDPYKIWLSEIILQQTRVAQGLTYYLRFVEKFPTVSDLATAPEDEVLKLWQGLGYYSRARNLHAAAKYIDKELNGIFPSAYESIHALKGVGEYTAAAIASFAFHLPHAVVDGNVFRLLARYFGISEPIDTGAGKKLFRKLAGELVPPGNPALHNQAMMEFGALQCVPVKPACLLCPLQTGCFAHSNKLVGYFPVRNRKSVARNRYFNYFVIFSGSSVFLKRRKEKDIWKNLFEFPLVETKNEISAKEIIGGKEVSSLLSGFLEMKLERVTDWKKHLLSHQKIIYRFFILQVEKEKKISSGLIKVEKKDIFNFAVPKLVESFINNSKLFSLMIPVYVLFFQ